MWEWQGGLAGWTEEGGGNTALGGAVLHVWTHWSSEPHAHKGSSCLVATEIQYKQISPCSVADLMLTKKNTEHGRCWEHIINAFEYS